VVAGGVEQVRAEGAGWVQLRRQHVALAPRKIDLLADLLLYVPSAWTKSGVMNLV
jgi:hypothetical protein